MTLEPASERRLLGLIGLGVRGRNVVVGVEQVRQAARRGKLALAVVAPDASPNSLRKVIPLLEAAGIRIISGPGAAALGSAAGRENTAAIGITDAALARGVRAVVDGKAGRREFVQRRETGSGSRSKGSRRNG